MAVCLTLLVVAPAAVLAQVPNATLPTPERIRAILLDKTPHEKLFLEHRENDQENLRRALRLYGTDQEATCAPLDSVSLSYATLEAGHIHAVLITRSDGCWYDFVVILEKPASGVWKLVQTFPLFSKYDHPSVLLRELIKPGIQEVVIGRSSVGANGTGIWQYNTLVIKLFDGRPQVVFNRPAEANLSVPDRTGQNTDEFQHSTWYFVPALEPRESQTDILEHQIACVHTAKLDRWWWHSWDPETRTFQGHLIDEASAKESLTKGAPYRTTTDPEDENRSGCK